jgi:hypothetical protein
LESLDPYPSPALTALGRSHTLNLLLVRRDGPSDCGPLYGAFGVGIGGSEEHRCPNAPFNPKCAGAIRPMASAPE